MALELKGYNINDIHTHIQDRVLLLPVMAVKMAFFSSIRSLVPIAVVGSEDYFLARCD